MPTGGSSRKSSRPCRPIRKCRTPCENCVRPASACLPSPTTWSRCKPASSRRAASPVTSKDASAWTASSSSSRRLRLTLTSRRYLASAPHSFAWSPATPGIRSAPWRPAGKPHWSSARAMISLPLVLSRRSSAMTSTTSPISSSPAIGRAAKRSRRRCEPSWRRFVADDFHRMQAFGAACTQDVLLEQIDGSGKQHDVLDQKQEGQRCRRKAAGGNCPGFGEERNDRDGAHIGRARSEGAEDAELLVPEAEEHDEAEQPFDGPEKIGGAAYAECGIKPEDQRSVADEGDQRMGFIVEPFLATEDEEQDDHRRANEMIVKVASNDFKL